MIFEVKLLAIIFSNPFIELKQLGNFLTMLLFMRFFSTVFDFRPMPFRAHYDLGPFSILQFKGLKK